VIGQPHVPGLKMNCAALCEGTSRRATTPAAVEAVFAIAAAGSRSWIVRTIKGATIRVHGDEDPLLSPECDDHTAQMIREGGGE